MQYALMDKDLQSIYLDNSSYESCMRYHKEGRVIAERISVKCGFSLSFRWDKYNFGWFYDKYSHRLNLGRLVIVKTIEYRTDTGKVVYPL